LRFIRNDAEPLANGWFTVKQPGSNDLKTGITWADARAQEQHFFTSTAPWSSAETYCQKRFGTRNLTESLSKILSDLIKRRWGPPLSLSSWTFDPGTPLGFQNWQMNYRRSSNKQSFALGISPSRLPITRSARSSRWSQVSPDRYPFSWRVHPTNVVYIRRFGRSTSNSRMLSRGPLLTFGHTNLGSGCPTNHPHFSRRRKWNQARITVPSM